MVYINIYLELGRHITVYLSSVAIEALYISQNNFLVPPAVAGYYAVLAVLLFNIDFGREVSGSCQKILRRRMVWMVCLGARSSPNSHIFFLCVKFAELADEFCRCLEPLAMDMCEERPANRPTLEEVTERLEDLIMELE